MVAAHKPAKAKPRAARPGAAAKKPSAKPAKPKAAPKRKAPVRKAAPAKPARKAASPPPPPSAPDAWIVEPEPAWVVVPEPARAPAPLSPLPPPAASARPFNPATGAWIPVDTAAGAAAQPPAPPEARKRTAGATFWNVILGIDLALLALNVIGAVAVGLVLVFAPHSASAEYLRSHTTIESPGALVAEQALNFTLFGVIPLLWLLGTRVKPVEGTKRFLQLRARGKDFARGVGLVPLLLLAVVVLSAIYIVLTKGPGALADAATNKTSGDNPVTDQIVKNLTWPVAAFVAATAGIGEEIFFRGLLQKRLGVWGQAALFGLAHGAGGYPPQILFAFGLGVLFGTLVKRGWSLWTTIVAHALYDFTLLAIGLATR